MSIETEVDAYILAHSKLRESSRGYKAIKTLLQEGNLLYWCLGKDDTLELCKIFIYLNFNYQHVSGGLQLRPNSKHEFYHNVMYPKRIERTNYNKSSSNQKLGKDEPDDDRMGWAERQLKNK